MGLLNGYYISKTETNCTYYAYDADYNSIELNCDTENDKLKDKNMKVLTTNALGMIENAVWDTYGVNFDYDYSISSNNAEKSYLQEKGISAQYTGKNLCVANGGGDYCNDSVERTTSWTGLVGLMSVSDITYADGWLYNETYNPWSISSRSKPDSAVDVWYVCDGSSVCADGVSVPFAVFPSVYLKSDIQIISGNGDDKPYILK